MVAFLAGEGPQRCCVGPAGGLSDTKCLQPEFAGRAIFGKIADLLVVSAMPEDGSHDIHLSVTGGAVAALGLDRLQDRRRGRKWQSGTAVLLGDQGPRDSLLRSALGRNRSWIAALPDRVCANIRRGIGYTVCGPLPLSPGEDRRVVSPAWALSAYRLICLRCLPGVGATCKGGWSACLLKAG